MRSTYGVAALVLAGCLLAGFGCQGSREEKTKLEGEVAQLKANLEKTVSERDALKADVGKLQDSLGKAESSLAGMKEIRDGLQNQVYELASLRRQMQKQTEDLTGSRDQLQRQVDDLGRSHKQLQQRVELLNAARDTALAETKKAQATIDDLTNQLQAHAQQAKDLREQIRVVRAVLEQLQGRPQ